MRRVTLRLESLDDRVVPSLVSGDVVTIHRGDYLVSNPGVRDMFLRMHKETNRPLSLAWRIGMILLLAGLIAEYLAR